MGTKTIKKQPISKENATIIRALNNFGRVPEQHELLDEVERLQQELERKDNIINELKECMKDLLNESNDKTSDLFIYEQNKAIINMFLDKIKEMESK